MTVIYSSTAAAPLICPPVSEVVAAFDTFPNCALDFQPEVGFSGFTKMVAGGLNGRETDFSTCRRACRCDGSASALIFGDLESVTSFLPLARPEQLHQEAKKP